MSVGIHLALGGQITQRIDGLDPHSGILVFHQASSNVWRTISCDPAPSSASSAFRRTAALRSLRTARQRAARISGSLLRGAETFDGIEPNIGAELLAAGENIEENTFHVVVSTVPFDHNGCWDLSCNSREQDPGRLREQVDSSDVSRM